MAQDLGHGGAVDGFPVQQQFGKAVQRVAAAWLGLDGSDAPTAVAEAARNYPGPVHATTPGDTVRVER